MKTSTINTSLTPGASALGELENGLSLSVPAGGSRQYRLAQVDDYRGIPRSHLPHRPPSALELEARVNHPDLAGTWGFGLWNAPMSFSLGFGSRRSLPALPNTAWFFFASPQNHLSFRDDRPASGFLAQTFRAAPIHPLFFLPVAPLIPFLLWKRAARLFLPAARRLIHESAAALAIDVAAWHRYRLEWSASQVIFYIDGSPVHQTEVSPRGPLGLVIWVDNQFAAYRPDGTIRFGTLAFDQAAILEVSGFQLEPGYNSPE